MVKVFHLFPLLPAELRVLIWKFAVRDDNRTRGINFLDFYRLEHFVSEPPNPTQYEPRGRVKTVAEAELLLHNQAVPCGTNTTTTLGSLCNRSTHFIDSGLWSACFESREVMLRRFPRVHPPQSISSLQLHSTLTLRDLQGAPRHCTFFPFRDVIGVSLDCLCDDVTDHSLSLQLPGSHIPFSLLTVRCFAVEYDHAMVKQRQDSEALCARLAKAAAALGPFRTIYLIDDKLQRTPGYLPNPLRRERTFTANGGRYVQVDNKRAWQYGREYRMQPSYFSLSFVDEVQRYGKRHVPAQWRPLRPAAPGVPTYSISHIVEWAIPYIF
ncbi:hypothetical protein LEL_03108 [Akanthomyces lecanii RCEF 1005]|uniref:2EXR domain-containing protein n=1 Tax=Akanthomyces lecanii RCEF 1005 TaxID=1081108 RepID=A0A162K9B3_CORDF|nr:hypothetical protein LEL_03108 [Akanthomyces lecanii RCEF 1005]